MAEPHPEEFDWDAIMRDTIELSIDAVGAWMKCLFKMRISPIYGQISMPISSYKTLFAASVTQTSRVLKELIERQVCDSVTESNGNVTLRCRRMYRVYLSRKAANTRQKRRRGNLLGEVSRDCHDSVTNNDSQPPLNKSLNTRITTNFTKKGEEVENSKTESGHASTKPKTKKPDDPRAIHPAIAMVQEIMTLYPKKGLWDRIIREIGSEPDKEFFRESFELWLSVNGNPMNLQKWLLGPNATKRLPEVYGAKEDGTGKQNGNTNRRTSVDKLRDQSELLDDYPSEADLAGVKGKT
jgi:hypothetical protein